MEQHNPIQVNEQLQKRLRQFLKQKIEEKKINKTKLCEELGISQSVFYKRLSGASDFTIGELAIVMRKYGLSFDKWVDLTHSRLEIMLPSMANPITTIEDFLIRLEKLFDRLQMSSNPNVLYATREMPLFYYFKDERVAAFKLYFFARFIWGIHGFANETPFSKDMISKTILKTTKQLWFQYASIPSVEVWNPNIWDNTLQQVIYLLERKEFVDLNEAFSILDGIKHIVKSTQSMVCSGLKKTEFDQSAGSIKCFNNQITHTNNIIHAYNDEEEMVFITHDNPNYLMSIDPILNDYTKNWILLLQKHAELMDLHSSNAFFDELYFKIDNTYRRAETIAYSNS